MYQIHDHRTGRTKASATPDPIDAEVDKLLSEPYGVRQAKLNVFVARARLSVCTDPEELAEMLETVDLLEWLRDERIRAWNAKALEDECHCSPISSEACEFCQREALVRYGEEIPY